MIGSPLIYRGEFVAFSIKKYISYGPDRDAKIERIQSKIAKLEAKDELTGKQAARLERLTNRLERKTPEDEFIVHYKKGSDTFGVTIIDSSYDDMIIAGQRLNLVINGKSVGRSRQETRLVLNHPEKRGDEYALNHNETSSISGIKATEIFDMDSTVVSLQSHGEILFAETI